jgi:hypothetical protein
MGELFRVRDGFQLEFSDDGEEAKIAELDGDRYQGGMWLYTTVIDCMLKNIDPSVEILEVKLLAVFGGDDDGNEPYPAYRLFTATVVPEEGGFEMVVIRQQWGTYRIIDTLRF